MNYHNEQAEGILRKLRKSQEESPFEHRRRRILNDKKYESSKGQKNGQQKNLTKYGRKPLRKWRKCLDIQAASTRTGCSECC